MKNAKYNIVKLLNCFIIILVTTIFILSADTALAQETNYTYTNQEQDSECIYYYDSRYYDACLGRFLQPDSLDVPNRYAYVSNDPVNYIDPTGHWETDDFYGFGNNYGSQNYSYSTTIDGISFRQTGPAFTIDMTNYDVADGEGTPMGEMFADSAEFAGSMLWDIATYTLRMLALRTDIMAGRQMSGEDYVNVVMAPLGGIGMVGVRNAPESIGRSLTRQDFLDYANSSVGPIINETILKIRNALGIKNWMLPMKINKINYVNLPITEIPLAQIHPIHRIDGLAMHGKGEPLVLTLIDDMMTRGYDMRFPLETGTFNGVHYLANGHHGLIALGVVGAETAPTAFYQLNLRPPMRYMKSE